MHFHDKARRAASLSTRIARLQRLLSERPEDEKLLLALRGLVRRSDEARSALIDAVERTSIDVVDYRITQIHERYPIKSITESLSTFQSSLTAIHDSITNGPKRKARYSELLIAETTLEFEFFYPGSKGFMLSVPTDKNLFGGSLDQTSDAFFDYLGISSIDSARDASKSLGLAAISTLYSWVHANAKWGNTVDYEWRARRTKLLGQHIPFETFQLLEEVFRGAEAVTQTETEVRGALVGIDVSKETFHFVQPEGESFKGRLHSDFPNREWAIPKNYVAKIIKTEREIPATGEVKESFELVNLAD